MNVIYAVALFAIFALMGFLSGCGGSSVTVGWTAPVTRTDGTFLQMSEIGGYEIHYRLTEDYVDTVVIVDDHTLSEATISTSEAGSYSMKMLTYDVDGLYGPLSDEVIFDVN